MTEIALIGNPNSGKTSLFNLLTEQVNVLGTGLVLLLGVKVEQLRNTQTGKSKIYQGFIQCHLTRLKKKLRVIIY